MHEWIKWRYAWMQCMGPNGLNVMRKCLVRMCKREWKWI